MLQACLTEAVALHDLPVEGDRYRRARRTWLVEFLEELHYPGCVAGGRQVRLEHWGSLAAADLPRHAKPTPS